MDRQERIERIAEELNDKVNYLCDEYDVTLTEMLGVFEIIKYRLMQEGFEDDKEIGGLR